MKYIVLIGVGGPGMEPIQTSDGEPVFFNSMDQAIQSLVNHHASETNSIIVGINNCTKITLRRIEE